MISQSPRDGTLFKGDTVELVVSKGPVLVEVPGVAEHGHRGGRPTLEAAGFEVSVRRRGIFVGAQFVVKQSPASGDRVPRGSTITIYVV